MTDNADQQAELKRQAAERAVQFVESGMVVGLGTGSTAVLAVRLIGERLRNGSLQGIAAVTTSKRIAVEAIALGIPLLDESIDREIDLTIDGADEIDPQLNLIKGLGGALLREKIVAQASRRVMIVADETKLSPMLGTKTVLPVEVTAFGIRATGRYIVSLGARVDLRLNIVGDAYITDSGNLVLDCGFGPIEEPVVLAANLKARAGVVEHGLFLDIATDVIVGARDGVRHLRRDAHETGTQL